MKRPKEHKYTVWIGSGKNMQRKIVYAPTRADALRMSGYISKYGYKGIHAVKEK